MEAWYLRVLVSVTIVTVIWCGSVISDKPSKTLADDTKTVNFDSEDVKTQSNFPDESEKTAIPDNAAKTKPMVSKGVKKNSKVKNVKNEKIRQESDKSWNPNGIRLSDNPADWPGHLKPFGWTGQQHDVDTHQHFPKHTVFISDYVATLKPLVMQNVSRPSVAFSHWHNDSYFLDLPLSLTHWIPLSSSEDVTFKEFIQRYEKENIIFDDEVPFFLSEDVPMSSILLCEMVIRNLSNHWLFIGGGGQNQPIRQRELDTLRCVYAGQQNITLVSYSKHGHKMPKLHEHIDVNRVDYTEDPTLREVVYYKASVNRGDCIYIPQNWYWQVNSVTSSKSVDVMWHPKVKEVKATECMNFETEPSINKAEFPDETSWATAKKYISIHFLASFLATTKSHTYGSFVTAVMKDDKVFKDIVKWNDEYDEITKELFDTLDINKDHLYSFADLEALTPQVVEEMYGSLEDRFSDYHDVMADQQIELKDNESQSESAPSKSSTPSGKLNAEQDYMRQYLQLMQDALKESMDELISTGKLPNLDEKLSRVQTKMESNLPDIMATKQDQIKAGSSKKSTKNKSKAKAKVEKEQDEDIDEFSDSDSYDVVDDSIVEEILADDEDEVVTKPSSKTKAKSDKATPKPTPKPSTTSMPRSGAQDNTATHQGKGRKPNQEVPSDKIRDEPKLNTKSGKKKKDEL